MIGLNIITLICLYTQMGLCFVLNAISLSFIIYSRAFTPINMFIINLAIADILYSSCVPFYVRQFSNEIVSQSELGCRLSFILDVTSMLVNVFTVAALTLERYFCCREKKMVENDKSKLKVVIIYIISLWTFAIVFAMPKTLSIIEVYNNDTETTVCGSLFDQKHEEIYTIAKWIIAFALPYSIIIVFTILLLKFLKEWSARAKLLHSAQKPKNFNSNPITLKLNTNKTNNSNDQVNESTLLCESSNKNNNANTEANNQNEPEKKIFFSCLVLIKNKTLKPKSKAVLVKPIVKANRSAMIKKRTTRFVLAVVISFLCAWSPLWIFQIIVTFTENQSIFIKIMNNLTLIIVYLGGVVNPLLYMILTNNFREFFSDKIKKYFSKK